MKTIRLLTGKNTKAEAEVYLEQSRWDSAKVHDYTNAVSCAHTCIMYCSYFPFSYQNIKEWEVVREFWWIFSKGTTDVLTCDM